MTRAKKAKTAEQKARERLRRELRLDLRGLHGLAEANAPNNQMFARLIEAIGNQLKTPDLKLSRAWRNYADYGGSKPDKDD